MNKLISAKALICTAAILIGPVGDAMADSVRSKVVGFSGAENRLMLADRTVMEYDPVTTMVPDPVAVGDLVEIEYSSSESFGVMAVHSVRIIPVPVVQAAQ